MKKPSLNSGDLRPPKDLNAPSRPPERGASEGPMLCGDLDMRIDRNGTWYYRGSPIGRQGLVKLFASVLKRDEAGEYWLITPVEKARIQVEDAPFLGVELMVAGTGEEQILRLRTNIDEIVTIDSEHPLEVEFHPQTGEPAPYVSVRNGLRALLTRAVYYELVERGVEASRNQDDLYGIWSSGSFFPLGKLPNDNDRT